MLKIKLNRKSGRLVLLICLAIFFVGRVYATNDASLYTQKPHDPEAFFFTDDAYPVKADGKMDVSDILQSAINELKRTKNFGILFIPEGKYRISKTIHVPASIRLIGYGKTRPELILGKNTPGFKEEQNYMLWFTGGLAQEGRAPQDAGAGTFYSAISNIDFRIESGNPEAVAIRSHFAQHSFISHAVLNIGDGKSGIYDVGNEMENVKFIGGDYGINSSRTSPGWPMMMVDIHFEGQRKAAMLTREAGLTIVNMYAKNVPVVLEMQEDRVDRLFIENSFFENVSKSAIIVSKEHNSFSQLNLLNIACSQVPQLVKFAQSGKTIDVQHKLYKVKDFTYGLVKDDMESKSTFKIISVVEPLANFPREMTLDMVQLPPMESWVNIRDLGAKGDGESDDTPIFQDAIAKYKNIYVPQGWYRITKTLKMAKGTKLIGLHPFGTQLLLKESEPAFSGFGSPQPVVESSEGGDDIINGIGINTGAFNYRAVGLKWMASANSLINDVKFVGGHGTMRKPTPGSPATTGRPGGYGGNPQLPSSPAAPVYASGMDLAWDNQYWSLWVTNNGGGTIKDVWTATSYAASGFYVSHTSTPGRVYAMSLEHHVRNEARFENVANWKLYAFQFEEEGKEGKDAINMQISNSKDLMLANVWMYRVIKATVPKQFGIQIYNSAGIDFRNMHNYTQILPVIEIPVYEVNKQIPVYEWDFARMLITGVEKGNRILTDQPGVVQQVATGFEFAAGATSDSKGNVYFGEHRLKKVYKYDAEKKELFLLTDYPWKPFTMATDTRDNLLVIFRYDPQPGYMVDGKPEGVTKLPDDNPMYSGWGNSGWATYGYSIDPNNPDATMKPLERVKTADVQGVQRVIHPSSRWRGDFDAVVTSMPENSFIAPDGVTIIPETYDLGRSTALTAVTPGQSQPVFIAKENEKTTVRLDVGANGSLTNMKEVYPQGQYSNVVDQDGNLYIADGFIYVYDKEGQEVKRISVKERPISLAIGGKDKNILFITTSTSLYNMRIK